MTKFFLTSAAVLAVSMPLTSIAQTSGSNPGLFDVSKTRGWAQVQSDDPNLRQWIHTASASRAGTNCNIVTTSLPVSNAEFQAVFDTIEEQVFLNELRKAGLNLVEISPVQTADLDGTDAFRITSRMVESGMSFTAVQMQAVINYKLLVVTCGAIESAYGEFSPTLERFIDDIEFGSRFVSAKLENDLEDDYPDLLLVTTSSPVELATELLRISAEQSIKTATSE